MQQPPRSAGGDDRFRDDAEFGREVQVLRSQPDPRQPINRVDLVESDSCDAVRPDPIQKHQGCCELRSRNDAVIC